MEKLECSTDGYYATRLFLHASGFLIAAPEMA